MPPIPYFYKAVIKIANQTKATNVLAECIRSTAEKLIKRAGFDVTRNGTITAKNTSQRNYTVRIDGAEYTAKSLLGMHYDVTDSVVVIFAQNRTPYIIGSTTKDLSSGGGSVNSVNGKTGDVQITFNDIPVSQSVGNGTRPVYLSNDGLKQTTYSLGKSVPSTAVFTDTTDLTQMNGVLGTEHGGTGGATTLEAIQSLNIYPVGAIYMSTLNVNPSVFFGGTWVQLKDRFLLGAGDSYTAGTTGGEATHTLTEDEMPAHSHLVGMAASASGSNWMPARSAKNTVDNNTQTSSVGGGQPHNNMPPYLAVYMWERTA